MHQNNTVTTTAILADLDALMDSRLATLCTFGEQNVIDALKAGYTTRPIDEFRNIDKAEFKKRYDSRGSNPEIIKHLVLTPMVTLVKDFIFTIRNRTDVTPDVSNPKLYVNLYPYVFGPKAQKVLLDTFTTVTGGVTDVELIFMSNEELTPKFIKKNLALILKYDYADWLEVHSENHNFNKTICPEITMFGPAIFFDKLPDVITLKKLSDVNLTPVSAFELTAKPFIGLKLLNIENFSIALGVETNKVDKV